uniref:Uncharacterized protein n=1 Tax=uncultured prokaryote TaxID=198431 RepID=A0A0H5Q229_9ZZZZ|nr:hypothetical protein [uncultured prokaryote]
MAQATKQQRRKTKVRRYHAKVMARLMQQAYEEDYRREQMAESERFARQHFTDFLGERT